MTNFEVINGGRLEVLGGICNEHGHDFSPEIPALRNRDSSLCFVGCSNGPQGFDIVVEETIGGRTKRLMIKDCPLRNPGKKIETGWANDFTIPMYVSYDPAAPPPVQLGWLNPGNVNDRPVPPKGGKRKKK
jgi:hypothetical protein